MELFGTLLLEELVQLLVNIAGLVLAVMALTEARLDRDIARYAGSDPARMIKARGNLRDESGKVVLHLVFLCDALFVAASPNPQAAYESWSAFLSVWAIIFVSIYMSTTSFFQLKDRKELWMLLYRTDTGEAPMVVSSESEAPPVTADAGEAGG